MVVMEAVYSALVPAKYLYFFFWWFSMSDDNRPAELPSGLLFPRLAFQSHPFEIRGQSIWNPPPVSFGHSQPTMLIDCFS